MKLIEQEIQDRLEHRELGPVRIQWVDGVIDGGLIVECPLSDPSDPHAALVPNSAFDEQVVCPQGHEIYLSHEGEKLLVLAEAPEGFSAPVLIAERKVEFNHWQPGS